MTAPDHMPLDVQNPLASMGVSTHDVTLERMRSFVRVAERGSLSAVARELGVGQSTIKRHQFLTEEVGHVPGSSRRGVRVDE